MAKLRRKNQTKVKELLSFVFVNKFWALNKLPNTSHIYGTCKANHHYTGVVFEKFLSQHFLKHPYLS